MLATILFIGSLIITETPVSLVEHGKESSGHTILQNIRGVEDVDFEFEQMVIASKISQEVKHPCNKLMNRCGMPPLIIGNDALLLSSVITGSVNVFVSVFAVVKFSRRILLLQASIQMFVCQTIIGAILLVHLHTTGSLTKTQAWFVVLLLLEAKNVPIDAMVDKAWNKRPIWKEFMIDEN
ncbi:hypothetical protein Golob_023853 [Gossypium lobatum]|uniref:Uncharacterized protein n=1 Tax=Gossypium lobatum TaxID=34289 RepID=A0A7J8NGV9_9ROSI|nr:hypothetical protein [Gossypium lobatum]